MLRQRSVKELAEVVGGERTLVSHNLALLTKAHLISFTKVGNTRIYSANEYIVPYVFFMLDRVTCSRCPLRKTCKVLKERNAYNSTYQPMEKGICEGCEK